MIREETPYTFLKREDIPELLAETALWAEINVHSDSQKISSLRDQVVETVASTLGEAGNLTVNQPPQISDIAGDYNFCLHKLFKGALMASYSFFSMLKRGSFEDSDMLVHGLGEIYNSISRLDLDELAIVKAIETISFTNSYITLRSPGPTKDEIERHLLAEGYELDDPIGKIEKMVEGNILRVFPDQRRPQYYQVRYLSEWIVG